MIHAILIGVVIVLFHNFTVKNRERIQNQNEFYAEDAAAQKVKRVEGQFQRAGELVQIYASTIGRIIGSPEVNPEQLDWLDEDSPFDAILFTNDKGISSSADGVSFDNSGAAFFGKGMKGESGIAITMNSHLFNSPTLIFYAPVYYREKIIGVLQGSYISDQYLRNMLKTSYFGKPSRVFLCATNGEVIATDEDSETSGNILDILSKNGMINRTELKEVERIFREGGSAVFNGGYKSSVGNFCIMHMSNYDFVLVQLFPESVTTAMVKNANKAGVHLEFGLISIFACYALLLVIKAGRQRKILEKENREFSWVLKGLNLLFESRYCMANPQDDSYEYIVGAGPLEKTFPGSGKYGAFVDHHASMIMDTGKHTAFKQFFQPASLARHFESMDSVTYECHVCRNGHERWENLIVICLEKNDGKPVRVLFVRQDMTEMKQREIVATKKIADLDRKDRQYRIAITSNALCNYEFNVSRDLLEEDIIVRDPDGDYSLLHFLGLHEPCKMSEVFKALSFHILQDYREETSAVLDLANLRAKFEKGIQEVDIDFWLTGKSGRERCIRHAVYLTTDSLSGDIMAMTVARDITDQLLEQRRQTQALKEALLMAQHASEAKSIFLSNMSHDIRTPMNAIIGFATIAAGHLDNRNQVRDCLQKVLSSSNHLLCLINDILDMSRIESGKMHLKEQECNISELVHNIVTIIQPEAKAKQMRLFIDTYDMANEHVIADPLKLNQIFINLLSNAVKYTPAGGSIYFTLTQKTDFRHGYADYVFVIKDNGVGMSPQFVKHIFEPFTREITATQSGIQGTGLGMAITSSIVRMMGGTIDVQSEAGKGSTFTVSLALKTVAGNVEDDDTEALKGLRVLVVDDDFHACDSVDKMLKKIGMRPEWTTSGREAVYRAQLANNEGDPYTTYIIDWQMPDINGLETTRRIRKVVGGSAPIIILTAYEWSDIEEEAHEAGVSAFCAKPLFMSDLKSALKAGHNIVKNREESTHEKINFDNIRVLVVDDVEMNREIAACILTERGFVVEMANDGSDAVTMTENSPEGYYDAILMDIQMPTMNGYEATRAIRNMDREDVKKIPIIAMTANAMDEDRAAALKCGMNAHIAKPLDINAFFELLSKLFNKKR